MKYIFFKTNLFISSLFPLLVMIFLDNLKSFAIVDVLYVLQRYAVLWIVLFIVMITSCAMLLIWLSELKKEYGRQGSKFKFEDLDSQDGEVLNYFATYLVPLISLNLDSAPSILMNVLFLVVVGVYFVKNNTFYHNILLLIFGYHIYRDKRGYTLITKRNKYEIENNKIEADQFGTGDIFYID